MPPICTPFAILPELNVKLLAVISPAFVILNTAAPALFLVSKTESVSFAGKVSNNFEPPPFVPPVFPKFGPAMVPVVI